MRGITAAQQGVLNSGVQADWVRVSIEDAGGTYRDLTTWPGFNAVVHVDWGDDINSPDAGAQVTVKREFFKLSLSPFIGASALNLGFDPSGSFGALIFVNRKLKIECAVVRFGSTPSSGDWFTQFEGTVMDFDIAAGWNITLNARAAPSARLSQQYIKVERLYSYATVGGVTVPLRIWEPNQVYKLNEYILPASRGDDDPGKDKFLQIVTAGTSGTEEPVWTGGAGQIDGGCVLDYVGVPASGGYPVEQVMQNIIDDNRASGDAAVTLYVPTSPSWSIFEFLQERSFTLDSLKKLANQIGWDVRPLWRSGTSQFALTLYVPERAVPTVAHTFGPSDYAQLSELAVNILEIRNNWRVLYPDSADLWPDGTPKRKEVVVSDPTSIAKYGELFAEIQEDQSGLINTLAEATRLANAALSDSSEPTAAISAPLTRAFPWVELNDYYTFTANGLQFDGDLNLAVTAYRHSIEFSSGKGGLKTVLTCRGKPTIGAMVHINKTEHPRQPARQLPHRFVTFQGTKTPTSIFPPVVGGARAQVSVAIDKLALPEEYEHHVYETAGTTLDDTTFKTISRDRVVEFGDLIGGKTYYHRVVPRVRNVGKLVRMQPSKEQSFVAGRASAAHIHEGIALGDYPLNGGFETRLDTGGMPDHWTIFSGTYGVNFVVMEDGNGISGGRYMKLTGTSGVHSMQSAAFPIVNEGAEANRHSGIYRFAVWLKNDPANVAGNLVLAFKYYDYQDNLIIAGSTNTFSATTKLGHWQKIELIESVDVTTAVRSVQLAVARSGSCTIYVDDARSAYLGTPWYLVGDTTHFTDAYEAIPDFANGWLDAGPDDPDCIRPSPGMRRTHLGEVELQGRAKSGSVGDVPIWTLPESMWPITTRTFVVSTDLGPGELEVQSCGDVCLRAGGNGFVDLTGVRFFPKF